MASTTDINESSGKSVLVEHELRVNGSILVERREAQITRLGPESLDANMIVTRQINRQQLEFHTGVKENALEYAHIVSDVEQEDYKKFRDTWWSLWTPNLPRDRIEPTMRPICDAEPFVLVTWEEVGTEQGVSLDEPGASRYQELPGSTKKEDEQLSTEPGPVILRERVIYDVLVPIEAGEEQQGPDGEPEANETGHGKEVEENYYETMD